MVNKQESTSPWMITTIILAVLLFVSIVANVVIALVAIGGGAGGTIVRDTGTQTAPTPTGGTAAPTPTVEVGVEGQPAWGPENAAVTIVEFSDFECPFCGRFYTDSYVNIKAEYGDQVRFVFRDFPLSFHPRAVPTAMAAECVYQLEGDETFFEFHDIVFENQGALDDASLRSYAVQVGVSGSAFDTCYADDSGDIRATVNADFADGQAAGVSGTPTVFVNGQKIVGAQPYSVFKAAIDAELNN